MGKKNRFNHISVYYAGGNGKVYCDGCIKQMRQTPKSPAIRFKQPRELTFSDAWAQEEFVVTIIPGNPITKCHIKSRLGKDEKLVAYGLGVRKHGDCPDWEKGADMALRSALRWLDRKNYREVRLAIWQAFHDAVVLYKNELLARKAARAALAAEKCPACECQGKGQPAEVNMEFKCGSEFAGLVEKSVTGELSNPRP